MAKRKGKGGGFSKRQQTQAEQRQKAEQRKALWQLLLGALVIFGATAVFLFIIPQLLGTTSSESEPTAVENSNDNTSSGTTMDSGERPLADIEPIQRANYYSETPPQVIDPANRYEAIIKTDKGDMRLNLFAAQAPETVNNFVFLANQGFYDNTTFHRVIEGFMAQAGDPTATGSGGPGYQFADEIDPELTFDRKGLLAMANAGPGTNGSQFFITYDATPWLNGNHTIFGELIEGEEVLDSIRPRDPMTDPQQGDVITSIEIIEQ